MPNQQTTLNRQYLERALEILKDSFRNFNDNKDVVAINGLRILAGYLEGGIEALKVVEECEKTKLNCGCDKATHTARN